MRRNAIAALEAWLNCKRRKPLILWGARQVGKTYILKQFGEENDMSPEKNIDFEIYDKNNKLVKTISTDDEGKVTVTLPYGTYKVIQKNSTNGYQKVEPFTITVDKNDEETIELKDYKIPVPNTYTSKRINIILIIIMLFL